MKGAERDGLVHKNNHLLIPTFSALSEDYFTGSYAASQEDSVLRGRLKWQKDVNASMPPPDPAYKK